MINSDKLEIIRAYLSQELPSPYNMFISVESNDLVIQLPENDKNGFMIFDYLHRIITDSLTQILNLDAIVTIVLKTQFESRSFQVKIKQLDDMM